MDSPTFHDEPERVVGSGGALVLAAVVAAAAAAAAQPPAAAFCASAGEVSLPRCSAAGSGLPSPSHQRNWKNLHWLKDTHSLIISDLPTFGQGNCFLSSRCYETLIKKPTSQMRINHLKKCLNYLYSDIPRTPSNSKLDDILPALL